MRFKNLTCIFIHNWNDMVCLWKLISVSDCPVCYFLPIVSELGMSHTKWEVGLRDTFYRLSYIFLPAKMMVLTSVKLCWVFFLLLTGMHYFVCHTICDTKTLTNFIYIHDCAYWALTFSFCKDKVMPLSKHHLCLGSVCWSWASYDKESDSY